MSHEVQVKDELLALAALGAMRLALLKVRITGGLCDPSLALAAGEVPHRRRLISLANHGIFLVEYISSFERYSLYIMGVEVAHLHLYQGNKALLS